MMVQASKSCRDRGGQKGVPQGEESSYFLFCAAEENEVNPYTWERGSRDGKAGFLDFRCIEKAGYPGGFRGNWPAILSCGKSVRW